MTDDQHKGFLAQPFHHQAALYRHPEVLTSRAEDFEHRVQTYIRLYTLGDYRSVDSPKALYIPDCPESSRRARASPEASCNRPHGRFYAVKHPPAQRDPPRSRATQSIDSSAFVLPSVSCRFAGSYWCSAGFTISRTPRSQKSSAHLISLSRSMWPRV